MYPELNTLSLEKNKDLFQLSTILFEDKVNTILNLNTLRLGGEYQGKFDLIVGNPPYVRLQNIDSDTRKYIENNDLYQKNLFGSYDLSVAFIIKIVELLKEKGIAGLVLSRKIFLSAYGEKICRYLNEHVKILEIIDFGDNQMFRDKTTYTVIVVFQKEKSKESYSFLHCMIPTQHSLAVSYTHLDVYKRQTIAATSAGYYQDRKNTEHKIYACSHFHHRYLLVVVYTRRMPSPCNFSAFFS